MEHINNTRALIIYITDTFSNSPCMQRARFAAIPEDTALGEGAQQNDAQAWDFGDVSDF